MCVSVPALTAQALNAAHLLNKDYYTRELECRYIRRNNNITVIMKLKTWRCGKMVIVDIKLYVVIYGI